MPLMPYTDVRAVRDFRRYRTTVVKCGAPGTVVALSSNGRRSPTRCDSRPRTFPGPP